jgi:UDP-3-O-[3-hydroxymyristoyl] glucosamine N-acyltransferase
MRLKEINGFAGLAVLRDGVFRNLGFIQDRLPELLTFLESGRFGKAMLRNQSIAAVITTPQLADMVPDGVALGVCAAPRASFAEIHNRLGKTGFYWENFASEIHPQAEVHPSAWIAETNVRVGANSVIGAKAAVLERCCLGVGVTVGAAAVLGGTGFMTVRTCRPMIEMGHYGGLSIHDGARILAGAVLATGVFRNSSEVLPEVRIGSGAFVSHDVRVGSRSFVGHGSVINGNVTIGEEAWVGPGAVIANDLTIGDRAFVSLGAVVIRNVPAGAKVSGNFAIPHQRLLREMAERGGSSK